MTKSRWALVKSAVETLWDSSTMHVTVRLRKALMSDPYLMGEARRMLADRFEVGDFLESCKQQVEYASPVEPSVSEGLLLANRYLIRQFVGAGAMGEVYEAVDQDMHDTVALKLLKAPWAADSLALTRFRAEIKLSRQVPHRNVCRVHDLGLAEVAGVGSIPFLTMELLQGETLQTRLLGGPLSMDAAYAIATQILDGLEAAHRAGVLHLDLKCSNILVVSNAAAADGERVVITDFGL